MNSSDYYRLSKLNLPRTEENAALARKCCNPLEALKAFRKNQECELAIIQYKDLRSLLDQYGVHNRKELEDLLVSTTAAGLVSAWD